MKKLISYGLAAGVLAATSLIVATPAHAAPATGTASSMTVAPGGTFTATVTNGTPRLPGEDWCEGNGFDPTGLSLYVMLDSPLSPIFLPEDTDAGAFGSFEWNGNAGISTSVEVTIPENTPVGTYSLRLFCFETGIGMWGSGTTVPGDFTIAAAPAPAPAPEALPDTGQDDSAVIISGALGAIALVALGAAFIVVRRRVS
jgi:LPXTG-motif cell wall-anchored protein